MAALSLRYDHYSSQSMFEAACKRANLGDQEDYTASDVAAFRAALSKLGDRLQRVDDRLDSLLGELLAQAPQATAPMPGADGAESESATPAARSMPPQATTAMPAVTETSKAEPAKPAQAPQATTAMPATETSNAPESAKLTQAPMPAVTETSKAEPAKPAQPQPTTPPATETSKGPDSTKPAHVPQATALTAPDGGKPAQALQATAPMPAPSTEAAETRIVLSGVELADGDALFVCGDSVELGNWDPERARPMMRDGDEWIAVVPRGEGSFKFLRRTEEGDVTWESGENREIGAAVKIETSWQSREQ